jgi:hypothetical protein
MIDETPDDTGLAPDPGRVKRAPPTIDLEATEISSEPPEAEGKTEGKADGTIEAEAAPEPEPAPEQPTVAAAAPASQRTSSSVSAWVVAPFSGAVAAALVIAVGWMLGWPPVQPAGQAVPQVNASAIDDLTARVAGLEAKLSKPTAAASDPATGARIDALDKSLAALRGELSNLHAQSDKLAGTVTDLKSTPRDGTAAAVDLSAINDRLAQIERSSRAQSAEIADAKSADDTPLRRLVAAALLDVAVRHGDPYQAALATAKSLSPTPDQLKPLDEFAASGVPMPPALNRELLTLVPKLTPPGPENASLGTGIVDRLQAGAAKLVRIERTDATGNDRGAVVARVTAAALHNEFADARRELNTLSPADRAAAQAWLDKAVARDAALAASRQFADEAMAALAKPAQ